MLLCNFVSGIFHILSYVERVCYSLVLCLMVRASWLESHGYSRLESAEEDRETNTATQRFLPSFHSSLDHDRLDGDCLVMRE